MILRFFLKIMIICLILLLTYGSCLGKFRLLHISPVIYLSISPAVIYFLIFVFSNFLFYIFYGDLMKFKKTKYFEYRMKRPDR